jgi:type IV pilus assembly protein PilB
VPKETLYAEGFTEEQLADGMEIFEPSPNGCDKCKEGYKGRVGIYEVVKITRELARIIMEDGNSMQLAEKADELGFNNLRKSGLLKVIHGLTSLAEANRMTTGH